MASGANAPTSGACSATPPCGCRRSSWGSSETPSFPPLQPHAYRVTPAWHVAGEGEGGGDLADGLAPAASLPCNRVPAEWRLHGTLRGRARVGVILPMG